jgi:Flp pilus assembly protein CpaB
MEMEYRDESRRGKIVVILGVILALAAGGAAFYLINNAQQSASQGGLQKAEIVVAARDIPARTPIEADDLVVRAVPIDPSNASGVTNKPTDLIGKVLAVTVYKDMPVTLNLIASAAGGGGFSILGPTETVAPDSEAWRAVSVTIPDDRAVGGLLKEGQTIDVFVTATVNVPQQLLDSGRYYTDRSTKVTYQDMVILARSGTFYVLKATLGVAEEISHLQATGNVLFSAVLRPDQDVRTLDVALLGETTNRIIQKYGLPVPETYPEGGGPIVTLPPIQLPTAPPSLAPGGSPSPTP